jgi:hypothetical protein
VNLVLTIGTLRIGAESTWRYAIAVLLCCGIGAATFYWQYRMDKRRYDSDRPESRSETNRCFVSSNRSFLATGYQIAIVKLLFLVGAVSAVVAIVGLIVYFAS